MTWITGAAKLMKHTVLEGRTGEITENYGRNKGCVVLLDVSSVVVKTRQEHEENRSKVNVRTGKYKISVKLRIDIKTVHC